MKRFISAGLIAAAVFMAAPAVSYAAGLSSSQVSAIVSLLQSFGANTSVIANVQAALTGQPTTPSVTQSLSQTAPTTTTCPTYQPPLCSAGQTPVSPGTGKDGCSLPPVCQGTSGSLTVTMQLVPAQTVPPGTINMQFARETLDATASSEDVHVGGLPILFTGNVADLSNCAVSIDGNRISNVVPTLPAIGQMNFVFTSPLTVSKGSAAIVSVACNISSGAQNGDSYTISTVYEHNGEYAAYGAVTGTHIVPNTIAGQSGPFTVSSGTLTETAANTSVAQPAMSLVAAGSSGVTIGSVKFHASGEGVLLTKVGLTLANGTYAGAPSNDVIQAYLYNGSSQVGTAVFAAGTTATSVLSTPVNLPKDTDVILTIKADIASVGVSSPAGAGDLLKIDPLNAQGSGVSTGRTVSAAATPGVSGVRIVKSYPFVVFISNATNPNGVNVTLEKFSITANPAGPVGIGKFTFSIPSSGATASNFKLYAYSDGNSQPVGSQGNGTGQVGSTVPSGQSAAFSAATPVEIPAGATYYFSLLGTVSPNANVNNWVISPTLLGDGTALSPSLQQLSTVAGSSNFVWSPNDNHTSAPSDSDWANGYSVLSFLSTGISQPGGGVTTAAPTCMLSVTSSSLSSGQSTTLSWASTNATSGSISSVGAVTPLASGSVMVSPTQTTTYTGTFSGSGGTVTCSASVTVTATPSAPPSIGLTSAQISAIVSLLNSFGAPQAVIAKVQTALIGGTIPAPSSQTPYITESQVSAIMSLLQSFGASPSIQQNVNNALRGAVANVYISASVVPQSAVNQSGTVQFAWNVQNAPSGAGLEIGITGAALDAGDATLAYRNIVSPTLLNGTAGTFVTTAHQTSIPSNGQMTFAPSYATQYLPISGPVNFTVLDSSGTVLARTTSPFTITGSNSVQASATIDQSSLTTTSSLPVLTGTVNNASGLFVEITLGPTNGTGFNPTITGNHWSGSAPVTLIPGTYPVSVTNLSSGAVLATGTLTVTTTSGQPTVSIYYPTSSSVFTAGSSIQLGFSSSNPLATFDVQLIGKAYVYDYGNVNPPEAGGKLNFTLPSNALPSNYTSLSGYEFLIYYNGSQIASSPSFTITAPATTAPAASATIDQSSLTATS